MINLLSKRLIDNKAFPLQRGAATCISLPSLPFFELQTDQYLKALSLIFSDHSHWLVNLVKKIKLSECRGTGVEPPHAFRRCLIIWAFLSRAQGKIAVGAIDKENQRKLATGCELLDALPISIPGIGFFPNHAVRYSWKPAELRFISLACLPNRRLFPLQNWKEIQKNFLIEQYPTQSSRLRDAMSGAMAKSYFL